MNRIVDWIVIVSFIGAIAIIIHSGWREYKAESRDRINAKRKELERIYRRSKR